MCLEICETFPLRQKRSPEIVGEERQKYASFVKGSRPASAHSRGSPSIGCRAPTACHAPPMPRHAHANETHQT